MIDTFSEFKKVFSKSGNTSRLINRKIFMQLMFFDEFLKPEYNDKQIAILRDEFVKYIEYEKNSE